MNEDTVRHWGQVLKYYLFNPQGQREFEHWMPWLYGGAVLLCVIGLLWAALRPSPRHRGQYVRGTRLVTPRGAWFKRLFRSRSALVIGRVRWPRKLESLHLLVIGAPGTGKSQTLHGTLDAIRARGDRAIVTDIGAEALRCFGHDGDILLNPFDARSVAWSPFAEMETAADAERLAKSMIPDHEGSEREWVLYSQALVAAVLRRLWEHGNATNESLLHALTLASSAELKLLVQGLPAQALFHDGAERMLASVRGIIGSHLAPYSHLPKDAGPKSWSIRRHVREGKVWLWLPYREDQATALRPLLAAWLGEAVSAVLSLNPDLARRHWLLLDEVASLGRVQGLSDALTKGRKYGLCAILGLQSVSQLRTAYGDDGAQTLLSCLSSQLILRANDPETADYASRHLGDCEVVRESASSGQHGNTTTKQHHVERLVLASEIQGLRNRKGYLRFAGQAYVRRVKVPLVKREPRVEAFVPRTLAVDAPPPTVVPTPPATRRPALDADAILKSGRRD
jgi:type IV secretory pathway TraG/TraD family ATPase VirD4